MRCPDFGALRARHPWRTAALALLASYAGSIVGVGGLGGPADPPRSIMHDTPLELNACIRADVTTSAANATAQLEVGWPCASGGNSTDGASSSSNATSSNASGASGTNATGPGGSTGTETPSPGSGAGTSSSSSGGSTAPASSSSASSPSTSAASSATSGAAPNNGSSTGAGASGAAADGEGAPDGSADAANASTEMPDTPYHRTHRGSVPSNNATRGGPVADDDSARGSASSEGHEHQAADADAAPDAAEASAPASFSTSHAADNVDSIARADLTLATQPFEPPRPDRSRAPEVPSGGPSLCGSACDASSTDGEADAWHRAPRSVTSDPNGERGLFARLVDSVRGYLGVA